jgi:hypothetical protein
VAIAAGSKVSAFDCECFADIASLAALLRHSTDVGECRQRLEASLHQQWQSAQSHFRRAEYLPHDCKHGPPACRCCRNPRTTSVHMERGIMKALIAALALVTLIASPTFAQTGATADSPTCGGYGWAPSSPCYGAGP